MKKRINTSLLTTILLLLGCTAVLAQQPVKVACVGNSITEGWGLTTTYPQALQELLGQQYRVQNFGKSGRTLLRKGDFPYWNDSIYGAALAWQPNIVIIKLGTNDSKPQNWQHRKEFVKNYRALIKSFQKLSSSPQIFICYPIPVFEDKWGITEAVMRNEVLPAITKVARKSGVHTIDLYNPLLEKARLTYDGVHPNEEGAALIASIVYKWLLNAKEVETKP